MTTFQNLQTGTHTAKYFCWIFGAVVVIASALALLHVIDLSALNDG